MQGLVKDIIDRKKDAVFADRQITRKLFDKLKEL
jgi:hypothetical protein